MNKSYNYILLDWDGCLAKTLDEWLKIYIAVVEKRGAKITQENEQDFIERTFGKSVLEYEGVTDPEGAFKEAVLLARKKLFTVPLYPNAKNLLIELKKRNKKIGLITSSYRDLVMPALKHNKVNKYFNCVITSTEIKNRKPDPSIIFKALDKLNGKNEEAIIVGDTDHDILAGHNANISSVLFYPEHNKKFYKEEFLLKHNPEYVIKDHIELLDIIK